MIEPMIIDIHHTSREDLIREVRKLEALRDLAIEALGEIQNYEWLEYSIRELVNKTLSKLKDQEV